MFKKACVPQRRMASFILILVCVWLLSFVPIARAALDVQPPSATPRVQSPSATPRVQSPSAVPRFQSSSTASRFQHYLALGDSLTYGIQPTTIFTGDRTHGYVDNFFAFLQARKLVGDRVNLGCPSETTSQFISGGLCEYPSPYRSQLTAAMGYLQKIHPGEPTLVTLNIGATDIINDIQFNNQTRTCSVDFALFNTHLQIMDANLRNVILPQLYSALKNPKNLLVLNSYNPFQRVCPNMTPLIQTLNNHLAADVRGFGTLVDVFTAFGGASNICLYTGMCDVNLNSTTLRLSIHPTALGYQVMARAVETAFLRR